jgi:hypothetical protein
VELLLLESRSIEIVSGVMASKGSLFLAAVATTLAIGAVSPLVAQSSEGQNNVKRPQVRVVTTPEGRTVNVVPAQPGAARTKRPQVRTVVTPEGHTAYVVEEQPKDTRSPRQRCVDEDRARGRFPLSAHDGRDQPEMQPALIEGCRFRFGVSPTGHWNSGFYPRRGDIRGFSYRGQRLGVSVAAQRLRGFRNASGFQEQRGHPSGRSPLVISAVL